MWVNMRWDKRGLTVGMPTYLKITKLCSYQSLLIWVASHTLVMSETFQPFSGAVVYTIQIEY